MRWLVLLRAVNLGPRNKVPMAELRRLLEEAGHGPARTYIASGNVLFDGPRSRPRAAAALERLVTDAFGVETVAMLRTPAELAAVVAGNPFGRDTAHTHVSFLAGKPAAGAAARIAALAGREQVELAGTHAYVRYPDGVGRSTLTAARLEQLLGVAGTVRNWRTVLALAELAAED
ncbi:MAG TPA: DUF1697 domain-containing protein [Gaiellaceae bacterium]|nr:DUF1697 domain-containing protein [Gaiellaceae bacterium]